MSEAGTFGAREPTSVVLAGPPGVGKTAISAAAAVRLGLAAEDLDDLVEARRGRSPARIIREDGEAAFRAAEAEALADLAGRPCLLALGGGTLTSPEGRRAARRLGPVLGLHASKDTLQRRLAAASGPDRPLLEGGLEGLLERRALAYAAVDKRVDAEGGVEEVATRVSEAARDLFLLEAEVGEARSRVLVGSELERAAAGAVVALGPTRPVLLIADAGIPASDRARYVEPIRALFPTHVVEVPGGEAVKAWDFAGRVLESAASAGCGRQSVVVGLGGGATCDLAGLVAHLLGRGAPLLLIPSTLLAQVDASVGGKCAVNLPAGRNLVGAFHAAEDVIADVDLLRSLPPEEHRSGLAELLKAAVIGDAELFSALEASDRVTADMIARAVALKARIVKADPYERDLRRVLNLGHTLGHGLEAATAFAMRHGEAVAIGMAAAARLSAERGWAPAAEAQRIVRALERLGLPTTADPELLERASAYIGADKKSAAGQVGIVCIHKVASVTVKTLSLKEAQQGLVRHGGHR